MMTGSIILAGQLLGTAFACGLNLYATIALLGIASRYNWIPDLPPGMAGLENGLVIGIAAMLYLIQLFVDRINLVGNAWEGVHTVIRPLAAALLTALVLHDAEWYVTAAACVAAAAMALAAHGSKAGLRLMLATHFAARAPADAGKQSGARTLLALAEDTIAVALAMAALTFPEIAPVLLAASLVVLLAGGPRLWRAATLGFRALIGRMRGFFGGRNWRRRDQLPRYLRDAVPMEPLGRSPARATPAAINGLPGFGAYRNGWLVFTCDGPRFLYRSILGARCAALPHIDSVTLRRGLMTDALYVTASGGEGGHGVTQRAGSPRVFTIFLLKDGASPSVAASELTAS